MIRRDPACRVRVGRPRQIVWPRERHPGGHQPVGLEPERHVEHTDDGTNQQTRADEEDGRHRHFGGNQEAARACGAAVGTSSRSTVLQGRERRQAAHVQRRTERKHQGDRQRDQRDDADRRTVERHLIEPRDAARRERNQTAQAPRRDEYRERAARRREDGAFDREL